MTKKTAQPVEKNPSENGGNLGVNRRNGGIDKDPRRVAQLLARRGWLNKPMEQTPLSGFVRVNKHAEIVDDVTQFIKNQKKQLRNESNKIALLDSLKVLWKNLKQAIDELSGDLFIEGKKRLTYLLSISNTAIDIVGDDKLTDAEKLDSLLLKVNEASNHEYEAQFREKQERENLSLNRVPPAPKLTPEENDTLLEEMMLAFGPCKI